MNSRKCLNQTQITIIDSLFTKFSDTSLARLHYAKGLQYLAQKLQRGGPLCQSMVETSSFIYRDIKWARDESARRREYEDAEIMKNEKKHGIRPRPLHKKNLLHDPLRDETLSYIINLLHDGTIKSQCDASVKDITKDSYFPVMQRCFKEKRKEAVFMYTRYQ